MKDSSLNLFDYMDFREFAKDRMAELRRVDRQVFLSLFLQQNGTALQEPFENGLGRSTGVASGFGGALGGSTGIEPGRGGSFPACWWSTRRPEGRKRRPSWLQKLRRKERFRTLHDLSLHQFDYLADPLQVTLREWVFCSGFQNDPGLSGSTSAFRENPPPRLSVRHWTPCWVVASWFKMNREPCCKPTNIIRPVTT